MASREAIASAKVSRAAGRGSHRSVHLLFASSEGMTVGSRESARLEVIELPSSVADPRLMPVYSRLAWRDAKGEHVLGRSDRSAVDDLALSPDFPLGVTLEVFIRREDAGRFIEEVRGDDPELVSYLRIEECELEGGLN